MAKNGKQATARNPKLTCKGCNAELCEQDRICGECKRPVVSPPKDPPQPQLLCPLCRRSIDHDWPACPHCSQPTGFPLTHISLRQESDTAPPEFAGHWPKSLQDLRQWLTDNLQWYRLIPKCWPDYCREIVTDDMPDAWLITRKKRSIGARVAWGQFTLKHAEDWLEVKGIADRPARAQATTANQTIAQFRSTAVEVERQLSELIRWMDAAIAGERPPKPKALIEVRAIAAPKPSRPRGAAQEALQGALEDWHKFDGESVGITDPILSNELRRRAGDDGKNVGASAAQLFWERVFDGHPSYRIICQSPASLVARLKLARGEVSSALRPFTTEPAAADD